jgi:uncharacterized membrane protein
MREHHDLRLAVAASVLCALLALLLPFEWLRLIVAAPLALLLPGYAIATATFARRPLTGPQLLLLSIALSLMTLALGGLILNYLPGGVRSGSWALLLVLIVLGACRAAAVRRPQAARGSFDLPRPRISRVQGGLLLGGVAAVVIALALAFTTLPAKNAFGYTELWMLPRSDPAGIAIGVTSQEKRPVSYLLRVGFGKQRAPVLQTLSLDPGETRTLRIDSDSAPSAGSIPVTATLFRQNRPESIYRRVSGWMPAPEASQ